MLVIYEGIKDFKSFCQDIYYSEYNEKKLYDQMILDYDVLIFNEEDYKVDKVNEYIEFYKYRPMDKNYKLSIFNNFDNVDLKVQNKLLKLFEDSEDRHVLIVKNKSKILNTIKSRAEFKDFFNEKINLEKYPKRYHDVLLLIYVNDEEELSDYLKFYDLLIASNYKQAYIYLTTKLNDYSINRVYEIIQYAASKTEDDLEDLLSLQKRLLSNTNKRLQIENYLLQK